MVPYYQNDLIQYKSHNSLKLSFRNFADCESFIESSSPDILAPCETNLHISTDSGNISLRVYLPLFQKDAAIHMHDLVVHLEGGLPFA